MEYSHIKFYGVTEGAGRITVIKCIRQIAGVVLGSEYHFGLKEAKAVSDSLFDGVAVDFVCDKKYETLLRAYAKESGIRAYPENPQGKPLETFCKVVKTEDGYEYSDQYRDQVESEADRYQDYEPSPETSYYNDPSQPWNNVEDENGVR